MNTQAHLAPVTITAMLSLEMISARLPVSYIDAPIDSKLWTELDAVCDAEQGCDYLTIPHNSNLANGRMAPYMQLEDTDAAKVAYAQSRLKREPIMEIFQHKGNSECINGLSSVFGRQTNSVKLKRCAAWVKTKPMPPRDMSAEGWWWGRPQK